MQKFPDTSVHSKPLLSGKTVALLSIGTSFLLLVIAGSMTYWALEEAYGAGTPHFSRTQNMDKWSDPFLELLVLDIALTSLAIVVARYGIRRLRMHS